MYSEGTHIKKQQDTLLEVKSSQHCTAIISISKPALSAPFRNSPQQTKPASLSSREPAQCNPKSINSFISIFSDAQDK